MPELRPAHRTIHRRGLVELPGDAFQAGQVDQDIAADPPHTHHHQPRLGPVRVGKPGRAIQADHPKRPVEQPIGCQDPFPEEYRSHTSQHVGQVEDGTEEPAPRHIHRQQQRQCDRDDDHDRCLEDNHPERVAERLVEARVAKQPLVILQADPFGWGSDVVAREADVDREQHRHGGEQQEADDPGAGEQPARDRLFDSRTQEWPWLRELWTFGRNRHNALLSTRLRAAGRQPPTISASACPPRPLSLQTNRCIPYAVCHLGGAVRCPTSP